MNWMIYTGDVWGKWGEKYKLSPFVAFTYFNISHMFLWRHSEGTCFNFTGSRKLAGAAKFPWFYGWMKRLMDNVNLPRKSMGGGSFHQEHLSWQPWGFLCAQSDSKRHFKKKLPRSQRTLFLIAAMVGTILIWRIFLTFYCFHYFVR